MVNKQETITLSESINTMKKNYQQPEIWVESSNVNDLNNGIVCGEPDQEGTINAFVLNFGGEDATEIVNLSDTDESNGWYTLSGIKLNSKPLSKGVYINNGRKIVVK